MQLWPVAHFFHSFITFGWVCCCTHPKVMTKWKKWATGQSCIRKEVTSYKIQTLVKSRKNLGISKYFCTNLLIFHIIYFYILFLEHIEGRKDPVGACTAHVRACGGGVGIFLRIRECRIVLLAQGPRIEDEEGRSKGCFQVRDHPY